MRGIATHRILELLDFVRCSTGGEIVEQIARLVENKRVPAEEAAAADVAGITWFLTESEAGGRVIEAARRRAGGEAGVHVRREIAFTWSAPVTEAERQGDAADWPTIRGTIDLLVVDAVGKRAEIIDYKTDSVGTWEGNLPSYERQMGYYLRAASDILGFGVERAAVVFLAARRSCEVRGRDVASPFEGT